jgi:hypothetical protein
MKASRAELLPSIDKTDQITPGLSLWLDEKRGSGHHLLTGVRPAREAGTQRVEAKKDEEAAAIGERRQFELGGEFTVSVYSDEDGERVLIYPRKGLAV